MVAVAGHCRRNSELALARRIVTDLRQSLGTALLIEGEAGIGKSRLVQWMVDAARSAGITALRGEGASIRAVAPVRRDGRRPRPPSAFS